MGIFDRLDYKFDDAANTIVQPYNANTINGMKLMPPLLNEWQTEDVGNDDVGGYFQNPVADICELVWTDANSLIYSANSTGSTEEISNTLNLIFSTAGTLQQTSNSYLYITNRQSNVTPLNDDIQTPHYSMTMGMGKMMSYLTYQSDGISNNAPMIGAMTSILIGNTLNSMYSTMHPLVIILNNSITANVDPETGFSSNASNITLANALALSNSVIEINNKMISTVTNDTNFFYNTRTVTTDLTEVRQFDKMGATQTTIIMDYIGTEKIKSRLTANN
jgi:hypothetical protein